MARTPEEQEIISNKFGIISTQRIIFSSNKDLFSNGSQEEIPLKQVVNVRFQKQKSLVIGIIGVLGIALPFGIIIFSAGNIALMLGGFILLALGVWMTYLGFGGFPTVVVSLTEGKKIKARGWPNDKDEAKAFALVLLEKLKN
jgi:hypothetical protein